MKVIAICLLVLIACTQGLQMYEKYPGLMNFSQKRSIMAVMAQVENTIKNGGPLDAITTILAEYENEIHSEQLAHDQLYAKQTAECEDEFDFRTGEIEEAQAALQEATETLDGCTQQQMRAKEDLAITKKQLKQKNAELINVHTARKHEKYDFDTAMGVFAIVHPAIEEALDFLSQLFSGEGSFLQMSRHTNKLLINAVQLNAAHHMAPILSVLAQLATQNEEVQADSELLNKLKNMFLGFKAKMEAENAAAIEAEEAAVAKFNQQVATITQIISNLEQQQEDLENEIDELNKCIITQQNIVASATQKISRNSNLLNDAVKMCHAMDVQYDSAKEGRAAELELLAAITVKVEEHFAEIKGAAKSAGLDDNVNDNYSNASDYQEGVFTPQ